jgi:hypothetical protein
MDEITAKLEKLISNIENGQPLSNEEYKLLRNSSKNIKDSAS